MDNQERKYLIDAYARMSLPKWIKALDDESNALWDHALNGEDENLVIDIGKKRREIRAQEHK